MGPISSQYFLRRVCYFVGAAAKTQAYFLRRFIPGNIPLKFQRPAAILTQRVVKNNTVILVGDIRQIESI